MKSRIGALTASAVAGAGVAYFFDPALGRSRRARTRDQVGARSRRAAREVERKLRYERGRVRGRWHDLRSTATSEPVDDHVLVDRVRSEVLGRAGAASNVSVDAFGGVVALRGELPDERAISQLCSEVAAVPGVRRVESLLHLPGTYAPNKEAAHRA